MSVSLLWRAWCRGHRMEEAGGGRSPPLLICLLLWVPNVNCKLYFFHYGLKQKGVSRISSNHWRWHEVSVPGETLYQALKLSWNCLRRRKVKCTLLCFLLGSNRVSRRARVTGGQGSCWRRQRGTTGMSIKASQCHIILVQYIYLHTSKWTVYLFFRGLQEKMGSLEHR